MAKTASSIQFHEIIPAESIMFTLLPPLYNLKMTIFHQTLSKRRRTSTNSIQQLTYNSAITSFSSNFTLCNAIRVSPTASKDAPVTPKSWICLFYMCLNLPNLLNVTNMVLWHTFRQTIDNCKFRIALNVII